MKLYMIFASDISATISYYVIIHEINHRRNKLILEFIFSNHNILYSNT